jgi:hypothetical protein
MSLNIIDRLNSFGIDVFNCDEQGVLRRFPPINIPNSVCKTGGKAHMHQAKGITY